MVGKLFFVPPDTDPKSESATGECVECGRGAGKVEHIVLKEKTDPSTQLKGRRNLGRHRQADERIHHPPVALGQVATRWIRRLSGHRHVTVLGDPQRVKPSLLQLGRKHIGPDPFDGIHCQISKTH